MTTLPEMWDKLLIFLRFRDKPKPPSETKGFATTYEEKDGYNISYIVANKLANLTTTDSQINVTANSESERLRFLQRTAQDIWKKKKTIASQVAGYGKVLLFPYTLDGKSIHNNIVKQSQVLILGMDGDRPVDIVVLADCQTIKTTVWEKYKRYTLDGTTHTITEIFTNTANGIVSTVPPRGSSWVVLPPFVLENVTRLLCGFIGCPIDSRNGSSFYTSGIMDGCESLIADLKQQVEYLAQEYAIKKAFVGASDDLFQRDEKGKLKLPENGIFKLMNGDIDSFFQIFDPAIRFDPIYNRMKLTLEMLENQIGLSRGILTNPDTLGTYTNKSNIKRSVYDTYSFVTSFRDNILDGIKDYLYACNVLAEHYGMTPQGANFEDISISIDWSNALIEDSTEEFNQQMEALAVGLVDKVEARQWLKSEDFETAKQRIDKMQGADVVV